MEALNDIDIGAADCVQRTHFVLAIFERPLFMCSQITAKRLRDRFAEIGSCLQRKQPELMVGNSFR